MEESLFLKILNESPKDRDAIQKDVFKQIQKESGRTTISYITNFRTFPFNMINFDDKAFIKMLVDSIPKTEKLDFILHSPGGFAESTEMIVEVIRQNFKHVRFIIPHSAKSAATILTLSGDEILMSSVAELGPIDPQINEGGVNAAAQAIIDGFEEVKKIVDSEGKLNGAYVPILMKMDVSTIKKCKNAIDYGKNLVEKYLRDFMFKDEDKKDEKAAKIAGYFSNHNNFLTHSKPITIGMIKCIDEIKYLKVKPIEKENEKLSKLVWEYFYRFDAIFQRPFSPINKIFQSENEYIVNFAPSIEVNAMQVPKIPPLEEIKDNLKS